MFVDSINVFDCQLSCVFIQCFIWDFRKLTFPSHFMIWENFHKNWEISASIQYNGKIKTISRLGMTHI